MCSHPRKDPQQGWVHELLCGGIAFGLIPGCFHTLFHDRTRNCTSSLDPEQGPCYGSFKLCHEWHGPAPPEDKNTGVLKKHDNPAVLETMS